METYTEAIDWLHGRLKFGVKPGLARMEAMLEQLGYPQRRLKTIHVAGTNGKGSTVSFLRSILQEAGYQVGTFTSPYIEIFNERISINGVHISDDAFLRVAKLVKPIVEEIEQTELGYPTEFEILTVIALYYFANVSYPDVIIFETGLGGRLDSTNVIHPLLSIITNVGHDHMDILGSSLTEIAAEKAGIIKSGIPVITAVEDEAAAVVIREKANQCKAKLYELNKEIVITDYNMEEDGERFTLQTPFTKLVDLKVSLKGYHQVKNAALALMAADYLKRYYSFLIEDEAIFRGLEQANWIGRFEKVADEPMVILDGAHNREGIASLVKTIEDRYDQKKYYVRVLFSALEGKEIAEMIHQLSSIAFRMTFTTFDFPRAEQAEALFAATHFTNKHCRQDWRKALAEEMAQMNDHEILIVTGSLYFISEVRKFFQEKSAD